MAIVALHSAATGLQALSTQIDVISNNLANTNNDGFKASRANFEDLFYQQLSQPGGSTSADGAGSRPTGIMVGLGTRIASTQLDFTSGSAIKTGGDLDLFIQGDGFFKIKVLSGGVAYTRSGHFVPDKDGNLTLNLGQGYKMDPPITIAPGSSNISVGPDGEVSYVPPGNNSAPVSGGRIQLAAFPNSAGLIQTGNNLFEQTDASGTERLGNPGENGLGTLQQGFVEASNVDPVSELVTMIKTQRAFELNSQSIQAADQMLQEVSNLLR
jgi:flagellar basal-body rod protein FlgG